MSARNEPASPLGAASTLPLMGVERANGCGARAGGAETAPPERLDEPPRKRSKPPDDAAALHKRVLEYKLLRLKSLRDRFTEQLSELYFLQAGGNMMDYAAWRKRPPAPPLLAFLEARRPAAAAPAPAELAEKARQEAHVAARVAELARAGLWPERRLPRVLEPPRAKSHWDFLLEEMAWLAQDFAHERKWKKQAAKKCARAVQKYFQDKAAAAQKAEKAQEMQLKKIAAFAAKEIRLFWSNVEKLVEWKRVRRVERARKEALDEQLSYIVDRTERYSRQLAANLAAPHTPPSDDEFQPRGASDDDEETIAAAERDDPDDDGQCDELEALRRESHLDLGDLLPPGYLPAHSPPPSEGASASARDSDDDSTASESDGASAHEERLDALVEEAPAPEEASEDGEGGTRRVEAAASLAASLQPTGTTLSDTEVATPVPRLLRHALREYQHVGLHWLATMHARRLNGILADEMGLGKTIQTIALLAHLALELRDWGPHLVVAPTSVVLNWEIEFKKWCPAFKILTYYGTIKERKLKRVGWTKANSFHVCITSYKLVVQDHQSFRRKKWKYLILDEAQNIKNFKSQRWQMLLTFQSERRLLLTGTPLQNSLLELWALLHFLMPDVFASHSEFRDWFGGVAGLADGSARHGDALLRRLHAVLRPFLLRRLKADVERQMPRKYEHVLLCRLAKRQRALYDDFMARAKTKESLASGNLLSVINVLMQLRKVCNHPDLFEPRPVQSPLQLPALPYAVPARALLPQVQQREQTAARLGGDLATLETSGAGAFAAHRARHLAPPRRLVEELPDVPRKVPPRPPPAALRLHLRMVPRAPPALPAKAPPLPAPAPRVAPPARTAVARAAAPGRALARLEAHRRTCARRAALLNERRCWRLPLWGADLRAALRAAEPRVPPRDLAAVLDEMRDIIDRFCVCWAACRAVGPRLSVGGGAAEWRRRAAGAERVALAAARPALALLHGVAARLAVAFPHPRLLQYDCGKLQTLAALLRRLKAGGHRVLIFTQMTRVLDVLEAFLSLHGHAYLRLDGATRVDARQPLVERFNADARVFAFILSTRSGGVGLNLTGADCVVFYDSDWNPTMDAQAQDRCHRIGQTRDVHVFRLVSAATVEENILRKAEQKRALGHLAIEDGHFTTSYLRAANVRELFGAPGAAPEPEPAELESALAAAEDEADAAAARAARAEAQGELAEFDETLPLEDDAAADTAPPADEAPGAGPHAARGARDPERAEFAALMKQLSPVERYAMRVVEAGSAADEERAALGEMRRRLREWEAARAALRGDALTYSREDARAKVRGRRRRAPAPEPPSPPPSPGPPGAPGAPNPPDAPDPRTGRSAARAPRTRSRGAVHIDLWTLDEAGAARRRLRNGTLDAWLTPDRQNNK